VKLLYWNCQPQDTDRSVWRKAGTIKFFSDTITEISLHLPPCISEPHCDDTHVYVLFELTYNIIHLGDFVQIFLVSSHIWAINNLWNIFCIQKPAAVGIMLLKKVKQFFFFVPLLILDNFLVSYDDNVLKFLIKHQLLISIKISKYY
jgi:hypothetical protein